MASNPDELAARLGAILENSGRLQEREDDIAAEYGCLPKEPPLPDVPDAELTLEHAYQAARARLALEDLRVTAARIVILAGDGASVEADDTTLDYEVGNLGKAFGIWRDARRKRITSWQQLAGGNV